MHPCVSAHRQHGVGRDSQHNVDRRRRLLVGVLEGRAGALSSAVPKAVPGRHPDVVLHSRVKARYYLKDVRKEGNEEGKLDLMFIKISPQRTSEPLYRQNPFRCNQHRGSE